MMQADKLKQLADLLNPEVDFDYRVHSILTAVNKLQCAADVRTNVDGVLIIHCNDGSSFSYDANGGTVGRSLQ